MPLSSWERMSRPTLHVSLNDDAVAFTVAPDQVVTVSVRVRGVDAPELHGRCAAEKNAARRARDSLAGFLQGGHLRLTNISGGKYYGRVLADLERADGRRVSTFLLDQGLARPYGGGRRQPWCD